MDGTPGARDVPGTPKDNPELGFITLRTGKPLLVSNISEVFQTVSRPPNRGRDDGGISALRLSGEFLSKRRNQ